MNPLDLLTVVMTTIFLIIVISYYILLFLPSKKKTFHSDKFSSISVIIPAHNEEKYISAALISVLEADFKGTKEVIVVDDGSTDRTGEIASSFLDKGVRLIRTNHSGKSSSINKALETAEGEIVAIVDADSEIKKDALLFIDDVLSKKDVVAATGVVRVKNRNKFICMWVHIEQLYNSLMRAIFTKVNANVTTPGPLSVYRKNVLREIGGFSIEGFSEDQDVTIRLIRKGYKIGFSPYAVAFTNMPYDVKGFLRQRSRFARGLINLLKRHMKANTSMIDLYTLPLYLFGYIQAVIMGSVNLYNVISGYVAYFTSQGIYMNLTVLKFFFEWFSIWGFVRWSFGIFTGATPLTFISMVGIISTLLTYPLYLVAIFRYDKKFDLFHLIPVFFMFPFWLLIMFIYIAVLPEMFRKSQRNIWKKNE